MTIRLPSLAAMRVFEAAARHENFTRAADELGMTQAAVSYQVRVLEDQTGVSLFVRERGRVHATPAAADLARAFADAFASMADALARLDAGAGWVLRLSASHTIASRWLAPRVGLFRAAHPGIDLRLEMTGALVAFGAVDAALRVTVTPAVELHAVRLLSIDIVPMCTPAFLRGRRVDRADDLLGLARLSPGDPWWRRWFAGQGVDPPQPASAGIHFESQLADAAAAQAGHGVALLTPALWRDEIAAGLLVAPVDRPVQTGMSLWFVCPSSRRRAAAVRAFETWLRSQSGPMAPDAEVPDGL